MVLCSLHESEPLTENVGVALRSLIDPSYYRKGCTNLFFLAGNRVLRYFRSSFERERKLTEILSGGIDDHVALVDKLSRYNGLF